MVGLSIIVPVYNAAKFLKRCMDSVLGQTYSAIEVICVDDGSADSSGFILDEYAKLDTRIKVVHQENKGVSVARNVGLASASGEWVGFVDPDDWIEPYYVEMFMAECQNGCFDMIWCDYTEEHRNQKKYVSQNCEESYKEYLKALFWGIWGGVWNKIFRRQFLIDFDIAFPNERLLQSEDLCFCVKLLTMAPRIKYLPMDGYHYVCHEGSAVTSSFSEARLQSFLRVEEILETLLADLRDNEWVCNVTASRREEIKFNAYSSLCIPDWQFYRVYPEIRSLRNFHVSVWHRILFAIAVRRLRCFTRILLQVFRLTRPKIRCNVIY